MPKKKQAESSSDTSVHSSDEESKKPAKKQKTDDKKGKKSSDDDSFKSWDIGKMKFVKVREFKGKTFVDIREFYLDKNSAEMKPGRKGISLSVEQWKKLSALVKEIDETVEEHS